ncbi:hypothetical protein HK102_004863 [Quaeritorhiza haematococci]|nr:hypothetical protein HK102_004863 [Quaeritorhiza haematococci]
MATVIIAPVVGFLLQRVFQATTQLLVTVRMLHTNAQNRAFFEERLEFIKSLQPRLESFAKSCDNKGDKEKAKLLSLLNNKLMALNDLLNETANIFGRIENKRTKFVKMFAKAVGVDEIKEDIDRYTRAFDATMKDICVVFNLQQAHQLRHMSVDLTDVKAILNEAQEERKKANNPINIDQITEDLVSIYNNDRDHGFHQALLHGNIQRINESDIALGQHLTNGNVYSIFSCTLFNKEDCVVKKPTSDVVTNNEVASLLREAKVLQHLQGHPYVVGFKGLALLHNRPSIVLEKCTEGTIHDVINRTVAVGWDVKLMLLQQLAYALEYMHSMGTCHGDLRPCNVLVTKVEDREEIRVIDFNHSSSTAVKTIAKGHNKRAIHGWELYMPPETPDVGAFGIRSDVYQAGLLFWEIACWTRREKLDEHIPASIPEEIQYLIRGCLQRDPQHRIDMMKASALIGRARVLGKLLRLHAPDRNSPDSLRRFFLECSSYANEYDGDVLEMVAEMYYNGDGTTKNVSKAVEIFEYLTNVGFPKACKKLRDHFNTDMYRDKKLSMQWGDRYESMKRELVRLSRS